MSNRDLWEDLLPDLQACSVEALTQAKEEGRLTKNDALKLAQGLARVPLLCGELARWIFANFDFAPDEAHQIARSVAAMPSVGFVVELMKGLGLSREDREDMLVVLLNGLRFHDVGTLRFALEDGSLKLADISAGRYPFLHMAAQEVGAKLTHRATPKRFPSYRSWSATSTRRPGFSRPSRISTAGPSSKRRSKAKNIQNPPKPRR